MADPSGDGKRRSLVGIALAVLVLLCPVSYGLGYTWARATHRLVRWGSCPGDIGPPDSPMMFGPTIWELVFLPAIAVEETARKVICEL